MLTELKFKTDVNGHVYGVSAIVSLSDMGRQNDSILSETVEEDGREIELADDSEELELVEDAIYNRMNTLTNKELQEIFS